jgi:hypothetical protein
MKRLGVGVLFVCVLALAGCGLGSAVSELQNLGCDVHIPLGCGGASPTPTPSASPTAVPTPVFTPASVTVSVGPTACPSICASASLEGPAGQRFSLAKPNCTGVGAGQQAPVTSIVLSYGSGVGAGVNGIYFTSDGNPGAITETCTVDVSGGSAAVWAVTVNP